MASFAKVTDTVDRTCADLFRLHLGHRVHRAARAIFGNHPTGCLFQTRPGDRFPLCLSCPSADRALVHRGLADFEISRLDVGRTRRLFLYRVRYVLDLLDGHLGSSLLELGALIQLHDMTKNKQGCLNHQVSVMAQNVLQMQERKVSELLSSMSHLLFIPSDTLLNPTLISSYISHKYTHILVYESKGSLIDEDSVIGILTLSVSSLFKKQKGNSWTCALEPIQRREFFKTCGRTQTGTVSQGAFDDLHQSAHDTLVRKVSA